MSRSRSAVPAIVVGSGHTALGALRSLVLARIPTYVACPRGDLATTSRWFRAPPGVPEGLPDATHVAQWLEAIELPKAVLVPGQDDAALWMADIPGSRHATRFAVSSSTRATLEILQDKTRFGEYLATVDVPHPRTFTLDEERDLDSVPFDSLERVFVKPADSQRFSSALGVKGIWAANPARLRAVWHEMHAAGFKVIAQEYVSGTAADHYFIDGFRDGSGRLAALFARRRLRIFPPDFGNSSYCESIPLAQVADAHPGLERLLQRLDYRGIFSAEFKRDSRTGEFKLLEINTRAWWYVEFAARCGVNVCAMAVADALGEFEATPAGYREGEGCTSLAGDIKSYFSEPRATRLPMAAVLSQWLRAHYHVFRFDDPLPGLGVLARNLRRALLPRRGGSTTQAIATTVTDTTPNA